ncbi:hypothetical protein GCM10017744_102350 [Streptomyces antimycoticus]|uniref:SH3b domain-containing protein n=1 Tax=Streptomyces antimycoticus TaxID=68175 RepID=A0A4D4KS42_9ACTN|nr:hypothetical protein SANT12839_101500 [Streptomyces antimycoticus]
MKTKFRSRAAAFVISSALLLGAGAIAASPASAAGSDGCTKNDRNHWVTVRDLGYPGIHTGPGAKYRKKGTIDFDEHFRVYCSTKNGYGNHWLYGKKEGSSLKGWLFAERTEPGYF